MSRGLYIHIPFCIKKCAYCDFYSLQYTRTCAQIYTNAVIRDLKKIENAVDTVYFGGGTPSVIGAENLAKMLSAVKFTNDAEITAECNPKTATKKFMETAAKAGINRISIGLQSANENELSFLTRTHSAEDVLTAVNNAKSAGINKISLDIMLGLHNQTKKSLYETIDFCDKANVTHISAYMLKIEQNTPFAQYKSSDFPDGDFVAKLYELCCDELEKRGFMQYEISNFAKKGYESRHNLKYWNCDEYYALGPAAHSFINGKRMYYPRDIDYYINGNPPMFEDDFGGFSEYAMLRLRLCDGLDFNLAAKKQIDIPKDFINKCKMYEKAGYLIIDENSVRLTRKGFLVQNSLLCELL